MINYKAYIATGLFALLAIAACTKKVPPYEALTDSKANASVYVLKSGNNTQNLTVFPFTDTARTINFVASFGAVGYPKSDIPVQFTIDQKAFDSLNVIRQNNGLRPFLLFPVDAYTISSLNTVIPAGGVSSKPITISYLSDKFDPAKNYLLPLTISNANGYTIGSNKTMFVIASQVQETQAYTSGWIATASSEQLSGENTGLASALIDGDLSTIWHSRYSGGPTTSYPHWIQFDMLNPIYVTKVSIAPRQDNPYGPTLLKIEGSLDGTNWTVLLDNQVFDPGKEDGTYQDYPLASPTNIRYLKVTLLHGKEALAFLSEIAVYRY